MAATHAKLIKHFLFFYFDENISTLIVWNVHFKKGLNIAILGVSEVLSIYLYIVRAYTKVANRCEIISLQLDFISALH